MKSRYGSSTGFVGKISESRIAREIRHAWLHGEHVGKKSVITFEGTHSELWSFRGLTRFLTGKMHFQHYASLVMSVDFDNDMITDYGFTGHSMATSRYLTEWRWALKNAGIQNMWSLSADGCPFDWTRTENHRLRGKGHEEMWQRFRAGVPWVKRIDGDWWFCGRAYSEPQARAFHSARLTLFHDDGQDWHWFTYDWDVNHHWTKRFIDEDAERRWNKRQAKKAA